MCCKAANLLVRFGLPARDGFSVHLWENAIKLWQGPLANGSDA
jgi:hypothetical protein